MSTDVQRTAGRPPRAADRQRAMAEALQLTRLTGMIDRKKGIRSYQSHVKDDPWIPILFALCFVLPVAIGALYYGFIVSDRYVTETQFAIRPAIGSAEKAAPDEVGTNAGVVNSTIAQDSMITQEYIYSRPMLETIEAQLPLREWFSRDDIDYFSRLNPEKPIEKRLRYWKRRVAVDIESASGIMSLSVEAFEPAESLAITQAILQAADAMVNGLSARAREDAVAESTRELKRAEERVRKINTALTDLRNRAGVLDAVKSNEATLKTISDLRTARVNLAVQLSVGQRDLGPAARNIIDIKQQIADLDTNIVRLQRESAGEAPEQKRQLSSALTQFEALENERKGAEKYYESVRKANEHARIIAARQVEYLSPIVVPVKAESSTEPRRTLMISLITAGAAVLFAAALFGRKVMIS
ncbi:capsule biosynthesis protein [Methylobacterium sp. E-046]|uniref:capsule biosynthesis protein n=1 Tax=Methylobacterium sp. E-046 TaxID=2836576 RepID=UPI001FB9686B|nr:capsule biosynthesis protein [Methylobacterium sp. E-046]MCJ2101250.1 capsule biosynthesis protein [Methylobacterium sp. E-046]